MKLRDRTFSLLIDIVVVLSGLILLLLMGYIPNETFQVLLEAVGTSLIAAGFVSFLFRNFYSEQHDGELKVISDNRMTLDQEYRRLKFSAREVDIVGIALSGGLKELATDSDQKMLRRVLFDGARVRLMFLHPMADYVGQRAVEDGVSINELRDVLKQSILWSIAIYDRLDKLYKGAVESGTLRRKKTGCIEIRLINMCPHFTMYRADEVMLMGIYTSAMRGLDSAVINVPKEQNELISQLNRHFDKLWERSILDTGEDHNFLVRYYDPNKPTLNEELIQNILNVDWKTALKKLSEAS